MNKWGMHKIIKDRGREKWPLNNSGRKETSVMNCRKTSGLLKGPLCLFSKSWFCFWALLEWFSKNIIFQVLNCWITSLPSIMLCLGLVSMKPYFPKCAMCSIWLVGPVCFDWSNTLSVFQKCCAPYHTISTYYWSKSIRSWIFIM